MALLLPCLWLLALPVQILVCLVLPTFSGLTVNGVYKGTRLQTGKPDANGKIKHTLFAGIAIEKQNAYGTTEEIIEVCISQALIQQGFRAAKVSPHEFFLAADVDTADAADTINSVPIMREAAKELGIKVRIGWQDYMKQGQSFIHVDVCPEYFGKGKVWNHVTHPVQWESVSEW